MSEQDKKIQRLMREHETLVRSRTNWLNQWQIVGEYVSQIKQDFEAVHSPGEFLNEDIYDSTGTFAAKNAAAALLGMLWPGSAKKSITIAPPEDLKDITEAEQFWYDEIVTRNLTTAMDEPKASLALALDEYMLDQVIFGSSGVGVFWQDEAPMYKPFGVRESIIDEGKNSVVNRLDLKISWELDRVAETYGEEALTDDMRQSLNQGDTSKKIEIIISYGRREKFNQLGFGSLNMPFRAVHVEKESGRILKEEGFEEFPIPFSRFRKLRNEKYGRSMAMDALPDIREINVLKEAVIIATEKTLDPPLGLLNNGMLGGGVVDTSAGSLTVFDIQGSVGNTPPVFEINTVGDLNTALARIEALEESIAQHFHIDRLLDFNNQVAMTATETVARGAIRNHSLSSLINRQIIELFTPLVERTFNMMLRNDKFGFIDGTAEAEAAALFGEEIDIIPERIAERLLKGRDAYTVRFTTPAERVTSEEELDGMIQHIQLNQSLAQTNPEAVLYLDVDKINRNASRLFGSPLDIVRSQDEVEEIQLQQAEAAQQQQGLDQAKQAAEIVGQIS